MADYITTREYADLHGLPIETVRTWTKQKKIPFSICRIIGDLVCVLSGTILCLSAGFTIRQITGVVGIGTIITAFFMGPLISFFNKKLAEPFLYGKTKTE